MKIKSFPKDGQSRQQNLRSQPPVNQRVFNNPQVISKGWYPFCPARQIPAGKCQSFDLFHQRIVIFRTQSGHLAALDAFCPHLGADLGNGRVVGEQIQCYFHQWEYTTGGQLAKIACRQTLEPSLQKICNRSYPVKEAYGMIWVFSATEATHDLPCPPTFENQKLDAWCLGEIELFVHHHVMMANGIDLQHFATVHNLDIEFDYQIQDQQNGVFDWTLKGLIPTNSFKGRLARYFLGEYFEYHVRFAGGSIVSITYGGNQSFKGIALPSIQVLWGCWPMPNGISRAKIFLVQPERRGLIGKAKNWVLYGLSVLLLILLKDEDIGAFPHMRFNTHRLLKEDQSLARLIQLSNQLELSDWGPVP